MNKKLAIQFLTQFINEMERTLTDKIKKNRDYAPQVFWKNKYTLEQIVKWLEEN
jgi:hypothetical protein